jgi:GNAT superfamily N-acetyltransferase
MRAASRLVPVLVLCFFRPVSSGFRSRGIGHLLIACAERWAVEQGLKMILVRSRDTREAAHRFYLREGFARTKTSAVFSKNRA